MSVTTHTAGDDALEQRVIAAIAAALDLQPGEVSPSVALRQLGAESLDFLDVAFRLEKEFRIRMPRMNLMQRAEEHFGVGALVQDGILTERGLEVVRKTMPEVDPARVRPGLRAAEVSNLFTVATFVRIVQRMVAAKREVLAACPDCGSALEESLSTPEAICAGCQRVVLFPAGDDVLLRDLTAVG